MRERGWQNARGLVPLEADRMGRGRRWATALVAGLMLLMLGLWHLRPWEPASSPRAEEESPPARPVAGAPPPVHLQPGVAPTTQPSGEDDRIPVEIDARTEDGASAALVVYAGTRPAASDAHWRVASGTPKTVEVSGAFVHWYAHVERADPGAELYEPASALVDGLRGGSRVALRLPRARNVLTVMARNDAGEPLAGVGLELSRASNRDRTRRTTGSDGRVTWEGIPGDLLSPSGVEVVETPPGHRLRGAPVVQVRRETNPDRAVGTAEIVLDECTAGFDLELADVRLAFGHLEIASGAAWERVDRPFLETDPPSTFERPLFVHEGSPRPGRLQGRALRAGTYRLTVVGGEGVAGITTLTLAAGRITTVRLPPFEGRRVAGQVLGPARGRADGISVRILEAADAAAPLAGEFLSLLVRSDGTFEGVLPSGVRRIAILGAGTDWMEPTAWGVLPAIHAPGAGIDLVSKRLSSARGRLVDAAGNGVGQREVWATLLAPDPGDREVLEGTGAMGIHGGPSKEDGRFALGPAFPGTWRVYVRVPKRLPVVREVTVPEGTETDLGDLRLD